MGFYSLGTAVSVEETFTVLGIPDDPTTVVFSVVDPAGVETTYTYGTDPEVSNPAIGIYVLDLDPPTLPGIYRYTVTGTGAVEASIPGDFTMLQNTVDPVPVTWAVDGPCSPWCDSNDVFLSCGSPMTTIGEGTSAYQVPVDMTAFAEAASWLLWSLEGRLHNGRCSKTVRPCGNVPCGFQVLSRGFIVWPWYGNGWGWNGYDWFFPGVWAGGCGCGGIDRINLSGYPVREILEVKIDGTPVPEFDTITGARNWRLDGRRFLTRMADADGNARIWPACQRLDLDDTEPGTFAVTYAYGQDPPIMGQLAAAQLACELYKAGATEDCQLPVGTVKVTRAGVTIEKLAVLGWFRQGSLRYGKQARWATGLEYVDAYLNAVNPFGLTRRPVMMAPGNRRGRFAQQVGQG
jgi:hypothetical protein